jgi:ankyrin repeat protein
LLAAGADPMAVTGKGETALFCASLRGNVEVMELLLQAGCPVTGTCLHRPVERRQRTIVMEMLARGADVNMPFPENSYGLVKGDTPIILAVTKTTVEAMEGRAPFPPPSPRADRLAIIDALLKAGADLSVTRRLGGRTPLLIAVDQKDPEIAARLVKAGADPNAEVVIRGNRVSAWALAERSRNADLIAALRGEGPLHANHSTGGANA